MRYRRIAGIFLLEYTQNPTEELLHMIILCLVGVQIVSGNRVAINPTFTRVNRFLADFTDHQLYHMRIKKREYIPRLIIALHIPHIIIADNGSVMFGEEAFLLLLYWFSFPRLLSSAQEFYGIEYSQLSRFIRTIVRTLCAEWLHLIDDNLDFFY